MQTSRFFSFENRVCFIKLRLAAKSSYKIQYNSYTRRESKNPQKRNSMLEKFLYTSDFQKIS